jgi:CRISPR-associated endonuclease/helicase Cas3
MGKKKKNHGFSKDGVELTDELIEKLAKEAEEGYEISKLTPRRGRPRMGSEAAGVFQVRLEPELRAALEKRADEEGTTPSELTRRLLRRELGVGELRASRKE